MIENSSHRHPSTEAGTRGQASFRLLGNATCLSILTRGPWRGVARRPMVGGTRTIYCYGGVCSATGCPFRKSANSCRRNGPAAERGMYAVDELVGRVPRFAGLQGSNDISLPAPALSDALRATIASGGKGSGVHGAWARSLFERRQLLHFSNCKTKDVLGDCTPVQGRFPPKAVSGPAFMPGGREQDNLTC